MSETQETKAEAAGAGTAATFDELTRTVRTAAYGSIALGAVQLALSIDAVIRGLKAAAVSPLAPGAYALLVAILLLRVASELERASKSEQREAALASAFTGFFVAKVRYITLTLALCAIGFLLVHF